MTPEEWQNELDTIVFIGKRKKKYGNCTVEDLDILIAQEEAAAARERAEAEYAEASLDLLRRSGKSTMGEALEWQREQRS